MKKTKAKKLQNVAAANEMYDNSMADNYYPDANGDGYAIRPYEVMADGDNIDYSMQPQASSERPFITSTVVGLNDTQVQERIEQGKNNVDTNVKTKTVGQILRENLITFFNFVFIFMAALLCGFIKWDEGFLKVIGNFSFLVLIIFNALIGIVQELRAKHTIDKLSLISAPKATVLRNGDTREVAVGEIVLDDITLLTSGSQICADAIITEGSIEVNESLITGEPDPIPKPVGSHVLSGSFVVSGSAKAQVEHVGANNFANKISAGAKYFKKPNSEIWRSLMLIIKVMAGLIVPIGIALFCVKYFVQSDSVFNGGDITINETVIGTVTTVLGMIPSGLVALSSTVFCVSVVRLSRRKILAQDLYCVETLARVDVICLDKTGTITEGTMDVNSVLPFGSNDEQSIKQIICNFTSAISDDNATINAMRKYASDLKPTFGAENIVPFSSARKWSGVRFGGTSYVIGAVEFVFKTPPAKLRDKASEMAQKGYRVMVLASSAHDFKGTSLPTSLKAESLIFITDRIREEAPDTLRFFREEGVDVKIISGDNPETVRAVAMRAGLDDCDNIIDMSTLTTDEEVKEAASKYSIFGRVLPDQKLMLVNALKAEGHTVAMTGDGVNDVLALKAADCSIAMASGSDAAKNVSSLVLLDSNFASMPKVVAEGRRSINNLERSAALYLMKTIYNTLLAILFMIVSHELPFTPQNLTLMGAVTIGVPSVILALEPNNERVEGRFLPKVFSTALPGGLTVLIAALALVLCHEYYAPGLDPVHVRTMFIIITTLVGFMLLANVCMPFSLWHLTMYLILVFAFVACYVIPTPNDFLLKFFSLNNEFDWDMGKAMFAISAIVIPTYVCLVVLLKHTRSKHGAFWEKLFGRLDDAMRRRNNNIEAIKAEKAEKKQKARASKSNA